MSFDQAAAKALLVAVQSHAMKLGLFGSRVALHAPLNNPPADLAAWITLESAAPTVESGAAAVSIEVTLLVHLTMGTNSRPLDEVDPALLGAAAVLLDEYSTNFTLGGLVREVGIFKGLKVAFGYVMYGGSPLRTAEITLPMIVNDAWTESP